MDIIIIKLTRDPKTGKMDKRVYHSLGTKDYDEALQKKNELDNQYKKIRVFCKKI